MVEFAVDDMFDERVGLLTIFATRMFGRVVAFVCRSCRTRFAVLAVATLVGAILSIPAAGAGAAGAHPGRNGLIAFVRFVPGTIYTVRPDGTRMRRLTWDHPSFDPAWAPRGFRMLYARSPGTRGGSDIWMMGAAGRHKHRITGPGSHPSWSPNGKQFVFVSDRTGTAQLYIYTFATGRTRPLTTSAIPDLALGVGSPEWSPAGDRIVFHVVTHDDLGQDNGDLAVINPDGNNLARLTSSDTLERDATWAPGGRRIAYPVGDVVRGSVLYGKLAIQRLDGTIRTIPISGDVEAAWSPDGRWIATARPLPNGEGGNPRPGVWLRRPDGSHAHRIVTGSTDQVDWQPVP